MNEVFVNMGQIGVMSKNGILTTVGLGSCVGVVLYDAYSKVGAMAHVFLAESRKDSNGALTPGKYADTAIPALIECAVKAGADRNRLTAKIAGGAHLFSNFGSNSLNVGSKNIKAVIEQLEKANIPIISQDTAGNRGRKMRLFVETGIVEVTTIGQESKEI
ncbi:MAG: chemotaxis protein CheD [Firmicutes bacterium]|nr:chemotaxis protein CheD [Bacillota bacterium]